MHTPANKNSGIPFHLPSLHRLIDTRIATRYEFGTLGGKTEEFLNRPFLNETSLQEIQL